MSNTHTCFDCQVNITEIREYAYILKKDIWDGFGFDEKVRHEVVNGEIRNFQNQSVLLCVGCVEIRLGRKLVQDDFNFDIPLNWLLCFDRSDRLKERLDLTDAMMETYCKQRFASASV